MSFTRPVGTLSGSRSLHSSADSDGPCLVTYPQPPQLHPTRDSLSASYDTPLNVDELIAGLAKQLQFSSSMPNSRANSPQSLTRSHDELPRIVTTTTRVSSPALWSDPDRDYLQLMKRLELLAPMPATFQERLLASPIASEFHNTSKNRYHNVLPKDTNLITLTTATNHLSNYIHANRFHSLIVTQGPLHTTLADFWMMHFEQNVQRIICLTGHRELKEQRLVEKTFPYWNPAAAEHLESIENPKEGQILFEQTISERHFQVRLHQAIERVAVCEQQKDQFLTKQKFAITFGETTKIVEQWHYVNWPDHGACSKELLRQLVQYVVSDATQSVHCSAGIGRSGTFAVIYKLYTHFCKTGHIPSENDVLTSIIELRQSRPGSVQTPVQLRLIFELLELLIRK